MKEQTEVFMAKNLPAMLEDIKKIVAVRSVKGEAEVGMPFGRGPAQAIACMEQIAEGHGFSGKNFDNYMLEINLNDKPDALGILCHLDVVPEGIGWSSPPYEAKVRDGRIFGRGTADNKGPAIAVLYAMKAVRELNIPLSKNVRFMLGTDEECGSSDLVEYFKRRDPPPFSFSPDAAFPVYNIEKGRLEGVFSADFPLSQKLPRLLSIESGTAANVVPPRAYARVEGLESGLLEVEMEKCSHETGVSFTVKTENGITTIQAEGVGAHASTPENGKNAAAAMLKLLTALPFPESIGSKALKAAEFLLPYGDWCGDRLGVKMTDELSGALTCNLGILKYDGSSFCGTIDIRSPICSNEKNMADVVKAAFKKSGLAFNAPPMVLPHHVSADLPFIKTLLSAYEEHTGKAPECVSMGGGTYVHGMANSVAFGAAYPETETFAHSADEYSVIEELETCVKIFVQVIVEMCK